MLGPVAHLGYFHERFVQRERWITAEAYADLVGLCQLLPGPSSSQVGMGLGLIRAGWLGDLAAWAGLTVPSAALMVLAASLLSAHPCWIDGGWMHGLMVAAVAVVAQAAAGAAAQWFPAHRCLGVRRWSCGAPFAGASAGAQRLD